MRRSITIRIALIFVGLMAFVILATWCVNNWWLESYYMREKVKTLDYAYTQLDEIAVNASMSGGNIIEDYHRQYNGNMDTEQPGSLQQVFRVFSEKYNTSILLIDSLTDRILFPNIQEGEFIVERVKIYLFGIQIPDVEVIHEVENYTVQKYYNRSLKSHYLESWGYLNDNRTIFLMSTPLASLKESVTLSNRFLAYVGLGTLLISSVIVYFTTKRITMPILELAGISEQMSRLDFEAKYTGQAEDEIGILGHSMNALSEKLKDTILELQSANKELQKDIEEKIQIDEMRKDFIANVSHELKTPIALIQGYAEGLAEGMCETKESRNDYCEVIIDEANKMNTMVRQLLNLSALEFGGDTLSIQEVDLVGLIKGVVSAASILIEQKQVKIEFVHEGPILVWADEFRIEEVITNYLNNALNHVNEEKRIRIDLTENESYVRVSVFNTGEWIPQEDIENLWSKFYKVDKARTRAYGGSGIGLSIVKAIMESHQTGYGVENVEGGVSFWFDLKRMI